MNKGITQLHFSTDYQHQPRIYEKRICPTFIKRCKLTATITGTTTSSNSLLGFKPKISLQNMFKTSIQHVHGKDNVIAVMIIVDTLTLTVTCHTHHSIVDIPLAY